MAGFEIINVTPAQVTVALAVPAADAADNVDMVDVIGNKSDTIAGDSLVGLTKLLKETTPIIVERPTSNLPQGTQAALFTITGDVIITRIVGVITTGIQAQETVVKLVANPTGLADVDICAALDINGAVAGGKLHITGTFADAMVLSADGVFEFQPTVIELSAGTLDLDADDDSSTGQIQWTVHYIKASSTGAVAAA